jgi:two-component system cell cycle response regulator
VLTRVNNRRAIMEYARAQLTAISAHNAPMSAIMFDIDHFKAINDTYGHQVGDNVLREVAQRIDGVMEGNNAIGRFGGEEFFIVLPSVPSETALATAEQLRAYIADIPVVVEEEYITVTASFGVSTFNHPRLDLLDALIARADAALYRAKANGRNRVEWDDTSPA